ncbi:unnamed protein product [Gordionus sp. m RMFG-2023]|uniref:uncharacterized protein LOC135922072 n=1 Tax=Gordionus sp. m RMFG-2023 TaxID=3053472 RepID=UPI0030E5A1AC
MISNTTKKKRSRKRKTADLNWIIKQNSSFKTNSCCDKEDEETLYSENTDESSSNLIRKKFAKLKFSARANLCTENNARCANCRRLINEPESKIFKKRYIKHVRSKNFMEDYMSSGTQSKSLSPIMLENKTKPNLHKRKRLHNIDQVLHNDINEKIKIICPANANNIDKSQLIETQISDMEIDSRDITTSSNENSVDEETSVSNNEGLEADDEQSDWEFVKSFANRKLGCISENPPPQFICIDCYNCGF